MCVCVCVYIYIYIYIFMYSLPLLFPGLKYHRCYTVGILLNIIETFLSSAFVFCHLQYGVKPIRWNVHTRLHFLVFECLVFFCFFPHAFHFFEITHWNSAFSLSLEHNLAYLKFLSANPISKSSISMFHFLLNIKISFPSHFKYLRDTERFGVVCILSHVWLFATPWTVACQAPLSMKFSRQEYWSGLPLPTQGDLLHPRTESTSPSTSAGGRSILNYCAPWEARNFLEWSLTF